MHNFFKSSPSQEETINIVGRHTERVALFIARQINPSPFIVTTVTSLPDPKFFEIPRGRIRHPSPMYYNIKTLH